MLGLNFEREINYMTLKGKHENKTSFLFLTIMRAHGWHTTYENLFKIIIVKVIWISAKFVDQSESETNFCTTVTIEACRVKFQIFIFLLCMAFRRGVVCS